jgi:hypothetical protein
MIAYVRLRSIAVALAVVISAAVGSSAAAAVVSSLDGQQPSASVAYTSGLVATDRARVLGADWSASKDVLWEFTSSGDGLGVLRAPVSTGAAWSPVVSLRIAGVSSRQWIGQGCLISGTHTLAVAYGPVEYISVATMFERGAYAALVDLDSGVTKPLAVRPTFSYFSPTCGPRQTATFTAFGTDERTTSAVDVDVSGTETLVVKHAAGELIDATRNLDGSVVAVNGSMVVRVAHGRQRTLSHEGSAIYDLHVDASGRPAYLVDTPGRTQVRQLDAGGGATIASGPRGKVAIDAIASGDIVAHGLGLRRTRGLDIALAQAPAEARPSLEGTVYVQPSGTPDASGVRMKITSADGASATVPLPQRVTDPALSGMSAQRTRRASTAAALTTTSATTDANLPCAIQRNDVKTEAYQPSAAQVEWAVDQAVTGHLTTSRPPNYRGYGLPAYTAQGLEPLTTFSGGSVPPQVMLGILANESNLWQASSHVSIGGYGNPLTGNVYGRTYDSTGNASMTIDFSHADCGYGISQVTDGMRKGQMSATTQRAIALDYQVNIAAGLDILISKWKQLEGDGIKMNNGSPSAIENWYAAAWAYNSGLQPNAANGNTSGCTPSPSCTDTDGHWGLGWANNPSNPIYEPNRHMFHSDGSDPATPARWPYQERVIGWAAFPLYEPNGSYSQAWWTTEATRLAAIPDTRLFCTPANNCTPGATVGSPGACNLSEPPSKLHCWIHYPISWQDCASGVCGHGQARYSAGAAEPRDPATADAPDCNVALPTNATIVDDLTSPSPFASCHSLTTTGDFTFTFASDTNGNYPAHIDLHQINGGLNGHYWFTHSTAVNGLTAITGTWTFPSTTVGWGDVMVHVPALGAQTMQAHYSLIDGATHTQQSRVLNQRWGSNHWLSLGRALFTPNEKMALTSWSPNGEESDVAWDAVAFVPSLQPRYKVVALGDSYSAGEGVEPYDPNTDNSANACHRSTKAYPNLLTLPGTATPLAHDSTNELNFIACSFAYTTSITTAAVNTVGGGDENPPGSGWDAARFEFGEELQADQGYLDSRTDAVTISIGGNDARFKDVLTSCSLTVHICSQGGYVMKGDPQPLAPYEAHIISDLMPTKLRETYLAIHTAAPNAQIYVVGYPHIFPPGGWPSCGTNQVVPADQNWMNQMADLLATTTQNVIGELRARGVPIYYVDTRPAFAGHDACASDSWINAVVAWSNSGSGRNVPGTGSYHPKAAGQAEFALLVSQAMATHLPAR